MFKISSRLIIFFFILLSVFLFSQGLAIHGFEYRDDEIFYVKSTQEMLVDHNYFSPTYFGANRFQKPILYYWLILLSYQIFGVGWLAARFVAVVFAALTVALTWAIANRFFNRRCAHLSAFILMATPMFFRHAKNATPDGPLNFFIVLCMYALIRFCDLIPMAYLDKKQGVMPKRLSPDAFRLWWIFYIAMGLGFLIKGFAVMIVPLLTLVVISILGRKPKMMLAVRPVRGFLVFLVIACPWFLYMVLLHGKGYLDYMLVEETKNRLIGDHQGVFLHHVQVFFKHILFYLRVLLSYFSPWSVFLPVAIGLAVVRRKSHEEAIDWLLGWMAVVFFFFSFMSFAINHYMLPLSTPVAILLAWFFTEQVERAGVFSKVVRFFQKPLVLIVFTLAIIVLTLFAAFILKVGNLVFFVAFVFYLTIIISMQQYPRVGSAPFVLCIMIMLVSSQPGLFAKAGLTSHAVLQNFAEFIEKEDAATSLVAVGSNDIHEKEFQAYFDQKVHKVADSLPAHTRDMLVQIFSKHEDVYCLILDEDYQRHAQALAPFRLKELKDDYIFRRRLYLDKEFFMAVLRGDQNKVYDYLMQRIVLLKKN